MFSIARLPGRASRDYTYTAVALAAIAGGALCGGIHCWCRHHAWAIIGRGLLLRIVVGRTHSDAVVNVWHCVGLKSDRKTAEDADLLTARANCCVPQAGNSLGSCACQARLHSRGARKLAYLKNMSRLTSHLAACRLVEWPYKADQPLAACRLVENGHGMTSHLAACRLVEWLCG